MMGLPAMPGGLFSFQESAGQCMWKTMLFLHDHFCPIMKIQISIPFLLIFITLVLSCSTQAIRPNVVLIQLDDLGFDDIAHHGNTYVKTPNIDALAQSSVAFSHFYVNPVCAPTRAALLTGRHYLRTGVSHVHGGRDFVSLDETLISEVFQSAGYRTGMWGKWHSGKTTGYFPWERGFDEAYMAQLYKHANSQGHLNGKFVEHEKWADEVIVDYAIDFIKKDPEAPFFAYLSFLTCHRPLVAPEHLINKYLEKNLPESLATLYAMIDHADQQIGRVTGFLKSAGLEQNTLVLFMSDNGPDYDAFQDDSIRQIRNVNGLRGHKGDIWENGVRSPLFIKWTDHYEAKTIDNIVEVTDILPTLVDICKIQLPENHRPLDGRSFLPLLNNQKMPAPKSIFNYAHRSWPPANKHAAFLDDQYNPVLPEDKKEMLLEDQVISITRAPYKLLINPNNSTDSTSYFLADIVQDPLESHNLYAKDDSVSQTLKNTLNQWWSQLLEEETSFGSPVFLIGRDGISTIPLMAPSRKSTQLRTGYRGIDYWGKDEFAIYDIDVSDPGYYQMQLTHSQQNSEALTFRISYRDQVFMKDLDPGLGTNLGKVHLSSGTDEFKLSLTSENPDHTLKLFDIKFLKVQQ